MMFGGYGSPPARGRHRKYCANPSRTWNCINFAFTVFVDAMFTTLLDALFTKAFDVIARLSASPCVWRGGRAD
jgi:hypothetical protein